jgi:hypothetical protein
MLLKVLIRQGEGLVRFPDDATIQAYTQAIQARHRSLDNVFCTADGLKLPFQQCLGLSEQSMFYNGWLHGHYITNVFVFGADGRIIHAVLNVPGSVHDSTVAVWGGTYKKEEVELLLNCIARHMPVIGQAAWDAMLGLPVGVHRSCSSENFRWTDPLSLSRRPSSLSKLKEFITAS